MKWYISQRIVAIRDQRLGKFKKGDIFTIKDISISICKCKKVIIDIGMKYPGGNGCSKCQIEHPISINGWYDAECFAPLEEKEDTIELSEVMIDENGIVKEKVLTTQT